MTNGLTIPSGPPTAQWQRAAIFGRGETVVIDEFLDASRTPATVQIGWRSADDRPLRTNTPPDQAGMISGLAKPERKVHSFHDEIDLAVRE